jgi:glucose-1-phosphate adenylyltransferase
VRVDERSVVEDSVILPKVHIGRHAVVRRAILDKRCRIPDGMRSASTARRIARRFHVTERTASPW